MYKNYADVPPKSGIYKIEFENGKSYVGKTVDCQRRMHEHFNRDLSLYPHLKISRAINKYQNYDISIIEELPLNSSIKTYNEREKYWIAFYHSYEDGYNMTPGGDGASAGVDNIASKITQDDLEKIYSYLINTDKTYEEIVSLIPGTSKKILTDINMGYHYVNPDFTYPLRDFRAEHYGLENKHSAFYGRENDLLSLIDDLKNSPLPIKDLAVKYKIGSSTISLINNGKMHHQEEERYPLRSHDHGSRARTRIFSESEMEYIKTSLEGDLSMTDIGKTVGCNRKVIADINNGKRQKIDSWSYPLRKKPLKTGPKPH